MITGWNRRVVIAGLVGCAIWTASREPEREVEIETLVCKSPTEQHTEQEPAELLRTYKIGLSASTATSMVVTFDLPSRTGFNLA